MRQEDAGKLQEFVEATKAKGATDEFLVSLLVRQGWPQDDVYSAIGSYWERATGIALPQRTVRGESSRDAFLYLLSFSTLATWASALGSLLFRFIDRWFPDPVSRDYTYNLRSAVTWQMASIAVAFPIFLLVTTVILREAQGQAERLQSSVRKWLTYIALLLTAGAMIGDLIWFFDYFLAGEITSRFLLKSLTVLLICGAIFVYYLGSLRWDQNTDVLLAKRRSLRFGIVATIVVIVSFCLGFGVAGTPAVQRHIEADQKRTQDLRGIASAIYYRRRQNQSFTPLPATIHELIGRGIQASESIDPETKNPYEYRVTSSSGYELCATFAGPEESPRARFWHHGKGRACFTLDASQQPAW